MLGGVDGDIWYLPSSPPRRYFRRKKMNGNCVDKLIGKYCKIITKEPGDERSYVITGIVTEIDHDAGFIMIESDKGIGCLNIKAIVAIKPKTRK